MKVTCEIPVVLVGVPEDEDAIATFYMSQDPDDDCSIILQSDDCGFEVSISADGLAAALAALHAARGGEDL